MEMKLVTYLIEGRNRHIIALLQDDVAERMSRNLEPGFTCKGVTVTNREGESIEGWVKNDKDHWGSLSNEEKTVSKRVLDVRVQNAKVFKNDLLIESLDTTSPVGSAYYPNCIFDEVSYDADYMVQTKNGQRNTLMSSHTLSASIRLLPPCVPIFDERGVWEYPDVDKLNEDENRLEQIGHEIGVAIDRVIKIEIRRVAFKHAQPFIADFTIGRPEWLAK